MKRRQFLNTMLLGTGVPLVGLNHLALAQANMTAQRRLILVELAGANDGLNTLVPYTNDDYRKLRPKIGLGGKNVIALTDSQGLHLSLKPLMPLWERGELAWVQGLGYPKANRSHFKSIALWESGGDGRSLREAEGWMTHAIEHQLARTVHDPHGISLAGDLSVFASESGRWLSARSINDLLQKTPPSLQGNEPASHAVLALLQQRLEILDTTLSTLAIKLEAVKRPDAVPVIAGGAFGKQLRQVALMIKAKLDTPVYRVRLSGFDTHQNQQQRHSRLLDTLGQSLAGFSAQLKKMGEWDNTLIMTYSEFGRRAGENRSGGTDHGTAAPHLLLGGAVAGGLHGKAPDLSELTDGDPLFTMDYRALYHSMLVDGLGCDAQGNSLKGFVDARLRGLVRST